MLGIQRSFINCMFFLRTTNVSIRPRRIRKFGFLFFTIIKTYTERRPDYRGADYNSPFPSLMNKILIARDRNFPTELLLKRIYLEEEKIKMRLKLVKNYSPGKLKYYFSISVLILCYIRNGCQRSQSLSHLSWEIQSKLICAFYLGSRHSPQWRPLPNRRPSLTLS